MCGIVGYVGARLASDFVLDGLRRLEYRGYDSAGLATISGGEISVRRSVGKLDRLVGLISECPIAGHVGIGHTRWATHGGVTEDNAHPHRDCSDEIAVIHNGIVENHRELKSQLVEEGHRFRSQTDTEVIAHLVERYLLDSPDGLVGALRQALAQIKGASAVVVLSTKEPDCIVAGRLGNAGGVVLGLGEGENFVSSDILAILSHTRRSVFLESGEIARVRAGGVDYWGIDGLPIDKQAQDFPWDPISAAKQGYKHFMLKEIYEQPQSITNTIRGRVNLETGGVSLESLPFNAEKLRRVRKIHAVACGTAWHAALIGKYLIERLARIPVEVDYGSEFRYRNPMLGSDDLLLAVTQSGETVDTLAAMEAGREVGIPSIAVVNVIGSQASRLADGVIYLNAGPEIGVASTKAFTAQVVALYLLSLYLGQVRGTIDEPLVRCLVQELARLPNEVGGLLADETDYESLAQTFFKREHFLYLGRGINYPIALEGALKLKEISYIHAEGYPAGEMKHGPIALIDENMPVVAICVRDHVRDKMLSNIEQVKARGGTVIALATAGDEEVEAKADYVISVPDISPWLTPVLAVVPTQLLAYHIAVRRGCDVDQPRNLAKSVTVE